MSGVVITRRMAFEARIERRSGGLGAAERVELDVLYRSYDRLEMRQRCQRAGMRLAKRLSVVGGVRRYFLTHREAA